MREDVRYQVGGELRAEDVAELFRKAELRRPVDDLERIEQMLSNASLIITAWEKERLIGIARSLTDFVYCCYLSDLAVDKAYQRQGIGKALIGLTQEAIGDQTTLVLLAAPDAMTYYPHIGFQKIENGWIIHRER
jgi:predicted N-acetyltransferase YhbS